MKHILSLKYFVPLTLLLALQLIASPLYAQRIIRGTVTSFDHGETLPGVNVVVKGTTRGVSTDIEGRFQIEVLPDDLVLVFSFIGFEDQEIAIGNRTEINVELHAIATQLDELVVIGYGTVRKSDLTGAVSSLRPEDLRKLTVLHPEKALQGKAAGVQITTVSGAPGTGAAVRIRGVGTFNDSAPIFVVDGVIVNDISFLNSADIATMEVLKDASATAIYGSRGANGVVLITTFLGRPGQELPLISFSTEFGIQQLTNKIDLLSGREFAIISNEIRPGSFNNVDAVPNVDWQELVFQSAPMHNHQFSIAGSTPKTQYYVGLGLFMQEGIVPKSDFQRITLRINNTYNLSERIRLGNNISIAPFRQQIAPGVTWQVYRAQPVLEPFYADGSFGAVVNVGNPLADLAHSNNFREGLRGVGNLFGEFEPVDGLTFRSSFGVDA
ncbi:MAG TPA: SusC/RagA family TonB-linked outer membrane protein, partial [Bacteroidales bacterium]|nr:SusC/RagA family TonB-linked outer membrane protein [Bacteroidales bacterium]